MHATPTWDDQLWAATDDDTETPFPLARTVLPPWAKEICQMVIGRALATSEYCLYPVRTTREMFDWLIENGMAPGLFGEDANQGGFMVIDIDKARAAVNAVRLPNTKEFTP